NLFLPLLPSLSIQYGLVLETIILIVINIFTVDKWCGYFLIIPYFLQPVTNLLSKRNFLQIGISHLVLSGYPRFCVLGVIILHPSISVCYLFTTILVNMIYLFCVRIFQGDLLELLFLVGTGQ